MVAMETGVLGAEGGASGKRRQRGVVGLLTVAAGVVLQLVRVF